MRIDRREMLQILDIAKNAETYKMQRLNIKERQIIRHICKSLNKGKESINPIWITERRINFIKTKLTWNQSLKSDKKRNVSQLIRTVNETWMSVYQPKVVVENVFQELEQNPEFIMKSFFMIPTGDLPDIENVPSLKEVIDGSNYYKELLEDLDRLKDQLGGSPNYKGERPPTFDEEDKNKRIFGKPLSEIKDWARMTIYRNWKPKFFWKNIAKHFGALPLTQYEYTSQCIQRLGLLTANKDRILEILENNDVERYHEFGQITGLGWHPNRNGAAVEKMYYEFVDQFLTTHYIKAKEEGNQALINYFRTFSGVCFEDRARIMEGYIRKQVPDFLPVADYDSSTPINEVFHKENTSLYQLLDRLPRAKELKQRLIERKIFKKEYTVSESEKKVPTLSDFQDFVLSQQEYYTLENYTLEEFLETEFEIFQTTEVEKTPDNFKKYLQERSKKYEIEVYKEEEHLYSDIEAESLNLENVSVDRFFDH